MLLLSPIPYFIIKKINDYYNKKFPDPNLTISPDSQAYNLKASLIIAIIATIIGTILSATSCIITNTTDYYINLQGMDGIV